MMLWIRTLHFLKNRKIHRNLRIYILKYVVEKKKVNSNPFILKTMKFLCLKSVVDQIFKMNTSWCLLRSCSKSNHYFKQFPSDLHFFTHLLWVKVYRRFMTLVWLIFAFLFSQLRKFVIRNFDLLEKWKKIKKIKK